MPLPTSALRTARSLRLILLQLIDEALAHQLKPAAIHLRLAVLELDDLLGGTPEDVEQLAQGHPGRAPSGRGEGRRPPRSRLRPR